MDRFDNNQGLDSTEELRHWHSYRLQRLSPTRFMDAVDDILDNRSILISPRSQKQVAKISELVHQRASIAKW